MVLSDQRVGGRPVGARLTSRAWAWLVERRLVLLVGLLAALPVVVALVRALAWHWYPVSDDDGVIATRALDVFSSRSPLVGQYSQASHLIGHSTFSPGPLLYWLLAIPARIAPSALVITIGLVNVASVMGVVTLARRRGGNALMFATAIAVALMCHSLGTERLHDIWNPYVAVLPLLLLIFVCWSIACGDHRLLFLAVLIASFAAQAQVAFVFPALGLLLVAAIGLFAGRHRPGWNTAAVRRSLAAAFIVGLVCWSAPLYDEAIHRPGNLERIVQAGTTDHRTLGSTAGWRAVVHAVGIPPWWLRGPPSPAQRLDDLDATSAPGAVSAAVVLGALAAIGAIGVRRRRVDVAAAGGIGLVLCAAIAVVTATTPTRGALLFTITYTLWWASPVGMYVYLVIGWGTATLLRQRPSTRTLGLWIQDGRGRPVGTAAFAVLIAAVVFAIATQKPDELRPLYEPARDVTPRVTAALRPHSHVFIAPSASLVSFNLQAALVYALRRDGMNVAVGPLSLTNLDRSYHGPPPYGAIVHIRDGEPAQPGERVVTRVVVSAHDARRGRVTVSLSGPAGRVTP